MTTAKLAHELLQHVKQRGGRFGITAPGIGTALAVALVFYARACGLTDDQLRAVMDSAMSEIDGVSVGPPQAKN